MNKLRDDIEFLGLDYKKEIIKASVIAFVLVVFTVICFIFVPQIYISIMMAVGSLFVIYIFLSSYSSKRKVIEQKHINEFVSVISYFETFISNGLNVYTSLESILPFSSYWMANEIKNLLTDIDHDKTIKPFITFATPFNSTLVENIMMSIYQMVDDGENETRLNGFYHSFEEMNKINKNEQINAIQKSLDSVNLFPLVGTGIITVMLTFGIITIIGEMINVF